MCRAVVEVVEVRICVSRRTSQLTGLQRWRRYSTSSQLSTTVEQCWGRCSTEIPMGRYMVEVAAVVTEDNRIKVVIEEQAAEAAAEELDSLAALVVIVVELMLMVVMELLVI